MRDSGSAAADRTPCSGRGVRSGSRLCSCAWRGHSTPATSAAGEEGEEKPGERTYGHLSVDNILYCHAKYGFNKEIRLDVLVFIYLRFVLFLI